MTEFQEPKRHHERILHRYGKALHYGIADPEVALGESRKVAEAICKDLYVSYAKENPDNKDFRKPVEKMMLDGLAANLEKVRRLPLVVATSIRTIQAFGNLGSHDQGHEADHVTTATVQASLNALQVVLEWYLRDQSLSPELMVRGGLSPRAMTPSPSPIRRTSAPGATPTAPVAPPASTPVPAPPDRRAEPPATIPPGEAPTLTPQPAPSQATASRDTPAPTNAPPPHTGPATNEPQPASGMGMGAIVGAAIAALILGGGLAAFFLMGSDTGPSPEPADSNTTAANAEQEPETTANTSATDAPVVTETAPSAAQPTKTGSKPKSTPSESSTPAADTPVEATAEANDDPDPCGLGEATTTSGDAQLSCAVTQMRRADAPQTWRSKHGTAAIDSLHKACIGGSRCPIYEKEQRYFLAEVSQSDPNMMFDWSRYLHSKGMKDRKEIDEVLRWTGRVLERKRVWKGPTFVEKVDATYEMRATAANKKWVLAERSGASSMKRDRTVARDHAIQWLDFRRKLGRDAKMAEELCFQAAGRKDLCDAQTADRKQDVTVSIASVPQGVSVFVDGKEIGYTPLSPTLSAGPHKLVLKDLDGTTHTANIELGSGKPTKFIWRKDSNALQSLE